MKNKSHNERGVLSTMPGNVYGHSHTKAAGCSYMWKTQIHCLRTMKFSVTIYSHTSDFLII